MTTTYSQVHPRRLQMFNLVAVLCVALGVVWFALVRVTINAFAVADRTSRVERGAKLVTLLRHTAQDRVRSSAQVLAQDTRLQATVGLAELDRPTVNDLLQDLQKLDPQALFALLNADGKVVASLGAQHLEGLDLSTSSAVKAALNQDDAANGVWLVNQRVVEVAVSAIRVGAHRVGLLVVGVHVDDAALATAADAAGVTLALVLEGRPVWATTTQPEAAWHTEPSATIELNDTARYVVAAAPVDEGPLPLLAWAVPLGAVLFSTLAFWRRGSP